MSDNCSNHKKDVFGEADMKKVAEAIENLHYEAMAELFDHLANCYFKTAVKDLTLEQYKLHRKGTSMNLASKIISINAQEAWQISKPFMSSPNS